MGVSFYVQSFKKEPSCISGFIKCLGWYEVNLEQINNYQLSEEAVDFDRGIHSIQELMEKPFLSDWGFYSSNEFDFYYKATENYVRYENGIPFGLMFEPEPILNTIHKLLLILSDLESEAIEFYDEKNNLEKLQKLLEATIEHNGMISCRLV
jgi:hypothetical protein